MPVSDSAAARPVIPQLKPVYDALGPFSYALMRFATGAVMVPHGVQKLMHASLDQYAHNIAGHGMPFAYALAVLTFFTESFAAAAVAVGLFTRVMALLMLIELTVIIALFLWHYGYFWTSHGYEYALLWWILCLAIVFRGGGRYSLDRLIGYEI